MEIFHEERAFYYKVCYTRCGAVGHGQVGSHALDEAGGCALEVDGRALDEAGGQEHGRKCNQEDLVRGIERRRRAEGGRKRMWLAIM